MKHFIVVGVSERVVTAVLQGITCFAKSKPVVLGNQETRRLQWSSLCAKHVHLDFNAASDRRALEVINGIHAETPDVVVIPADCHGIRLIDRIRADLRAKVIPVPDLETLNRMDDKWQFYEFCKTHSIEVPATCYIGSKANLNFDEIANELGLPFVLKPSNESGSYGVQIIHSKEQYLKTVRDNDSYDFRSLIAQRYIDGEDVDLSLLAIHGQLRAFAIQQAKGPIIQFMRNDSLQAQAHRLCMASSFHGLMHIDARLEKETGKVFLIESNPRFWASLTASIWCGLNFVEESAKEVIDIREPLALVSGIAYLRHPLLRPAAWPALFDFSQRGRLTRSAVLDVYTLSKFMMDLPTSSCRYIGKRVAHRMHASKSMPGVH
jgi:predicted ATP-grasp superfamily ATP-dependent carboligase